MNDSTIDHSDDRELDERLARLTTWVEGGPQSDRDSGVENMKANAAAPWRKALATTSNAGEPRSDARWWLAPRRLGAVAAIAIAIGAVGVGLQLSSQPRYSASVRSDRGVELRAVELLDASPRFEFEAGSPARRGAAVATPAEDSHVGPLTGRAIAHSVDIHLRVEDVRSAFLLASRLASAAHGEHVESSTLTGDGPAMHGSVTLRVRPDRLDATLNALRELGHVADERRASDDLTTDLIDLDAQLRNERAVERELLELLARRSEAPLEEILKLRESLSRIRSSIERLDGRRGAIDRLVSLATVVVIIRPEPPEAPPVPEPEPEPASLGAHFYKGIADAFRDGMTTLANTCALLVRALVGGLPWWLAIVALIPVIRRRLRQPPRLDAYGA